MRSTWLSSRAILLHLTMTVLVAAMAGLTWWQASRALSGNTLSYVYAFEWPLLAGVVVYMWWDMLHERPDRGSRQARRAAAASTNGVAASTNGAAAARTNGVAASTNGAVAADASPVVTSYRDDEDEELAAYNRYLAELNASGRRKTWRHPT
ncbi:MAG TPA: hypothetical protein VH112_09370 [Acidimicrobiales bacterium]|nr:hypothetical protein [Acidimicrobiales bacterium]